MTDLPFMKLWVGDYLADTSHLSTVQHGAYLLLIMHYWRAGGLPNDDSQLARIAKMSAREWSKVRPVLAALFLDGWKHKRIETELCVAAEKHTKRVAAGSKGGKAKAEQREKPSNATAKLEQKSSKARALLKQSPSSQSQSQNSVLAKANTGADAPDPKVAYFNLGRSVLGRAAGALIAKVLRSQGKEDDPKAIAKASALMFQASTMADPAEWLGRVLSPKSGEFKLMSGIEGVL